MKKKRYEWYKVNKDLEREMKKLDELEAKRNVNVCIRVTL